VSLVYSASTTVQAVTTLNLVITFLVSASANQVLGMIATQQIIVLLPLFLVQLPANAGVFFNQLNKFTAFDFFDTTPVLNWMLQLEPSDPLNSSFEALGFESIYFLQNLGTLIIAFVVYPQLLIVCWICCRMKNLTVRKYGEKMKRSLYWGYWNSLIFESFSVLVISLFINMKSLSWARFNVGLMSTMAVLALPALLVYPFAYTLYLIYHFEHLKWRSFKEKHGVFYADLDLSKGRVVLFQSFWTLVRKILLSSIILHFNFTVIWQIALMYLLLLVQVYAFGIIEPL